jgi:hypothetical protein
MSPKRTRAKWTEGVAQVCSSSSEFKFQSHTKKERKLFFCIPKDMALSQPKNSKKA